MSLSTWKVGVDLPRINFNFPFYDNYASIDHYMIKFKRIMLWFAGVLFTLFFIVTDCELICLVRRYCSYSHKKIMTDFTCSSVGSNRGI